MDISVMKRIWITNEDYMNYGAINNEWMTVNKKII